ncbi:MAG: zinc-dependent metalloprotease, partial [Williamsia herbipolensis]|nr:zinc-dependent metalloprotease [Williamsia herbipolensis]
EEYARGITMDFSGIQEAAQSIDPTELLSNPGKIEELMSAGTSFEPTTSPEQKAALARLETLLALIEGWVERVVDHALADRIPSAGALAETMRRRRATGGPAEQTFATLVGLELRPRKVREAAALWDKLLEASDIATRDGVWAHPDLMPDGDDVDSPAGFIDRVIGGGTDDPIAELEKQMAQEASAKDESDESPTDGGTSPDDEGTDDDEGGPAPV